MGPFSTYLMARSRRGATVDWSIRTLGMFVLLIVIGGVILWAVFTIVTGTRGPACDILQGALGGLAGSIIDLGYFGC